MKILRLARWSVFSAVILATAATVSAQDRDRKTAPKPKTAEQEVRLVIKQWAVAVKQRDMTALGRMFADDLFITDNTGATRGKKEELEVLKPSPTTRTVSVENENVKIRTYPRSNVAIVNATVRMVFRTNGRDTPIAMRYTSVWEKRNGRWQLTVLQTARLAPKQS
ncbi:MAG: nuclear transport factor 2 family protein [Pyrinomonadaceae bacterium]